MRDDYIYVHLESLVNLIYSRGITSSDFLQGVFQIPTNILLLNNTTDDNRQIDPHTLLNEINGAKEIGDFLNSPNGGTAKWIDFSQREALGDLTANDIAELLYMGHMNSHLNTPFSYKLQNDFVYLTIGDDQVKTYYRRLKNFYAVLNHSLVRHADQSFNERRGMFRRTVKFAEVPQTMVRQLIPILGEGLIFAFDQSFEQDHQYRVPILMVSDSNLAPTLRSRESLYNKAQQVAVLKYHLKSGHWHFVVTDPHAFDNDSLY